MDTLSLFPGGVRRVAVMTNGLQTEPREAKSQWQENK